MSETKEKRKVPPVITREYYNTREISHERIIEEWTKPDNGIFHNIRKDTLGFEDSSDERVLSLPKNIQFFVGEIKRSKEILETVIVFNKDINSMSVISFCYKAEQSLFS